MHKNVMGTTTETTTAKLYKKSVEFMKSEGKYGESLADICERLITELKDCRESLQEKKKK